MNKLKGIRKGLMVMLLIVPISIFLFIGISSADQWIMTYGGSKNDSAWAIQRTTDGGYIVAGNTESFSVGYEDSDIWVLKLNPDGTVAWEKSYGGTISDSVNDVQQTTDGGYIVAGSSFSFGSGTLDAWLLKLDQFGTIIWQKSYGKPSGPTCQGGEGCWEEAFSVQETHNPQGQSDGYIVAGRTDSYGGGGYNFWVLKLNIDGSVAWQKTYDRLGYTDEAMSIQQTPDGGYIVAGYSWSYDPVTQNIDIDMWVLKLNLDGSVAWQKTYGASGYEHAYSIRHTHDQQENPDGYVIVGESDSFGGGDWSIWVLKLNLNGSVAWQKTYTVADHGSRAKGIQQTADGGYIVAGEVYLPGMPPPPSSIWLLKLNPDGSIAWDKTYSVGNDPVVRSIQQTTDGGYIVAVSQDNSDFLVLKLGENGEIPGCDLMGTAQVVVADTSASVSDSNAVPQDSSSVPVDTNAVPQNTAAVIQRLCGVGPNLPPVLDPIGDKSVNEGQTLTFTVSATDPEGGLLTYSASNLPSGASFNPSTRTFTWTPSYRQVGSYPNVVFTVTDQGTPQLSDSEAITITVNRLPQEADEWALKLSGNGARLYSVQQTLDPERNPDGYIAVGYVGTSYSDYWVVRLNLDHTIAWQKTFDDGSAERAYTVLQTTDGGYIVGGSSYVGTNFRTWILKLNSDGTVAWQKLYGGSEGEQVAIQQTADGGYIVGSTIGYVVNGTYWTNYRVTKLDPDGTFAWHKIYSWWNGSWNTYTVCQSIKQTTDGGYIVAGNTGNEIYGGYIWVLKLNPDGAVAWQKSYGGTTNGTQADSIQQTFDQAGNPDGYIISGATESFGAGSSDVWVLKLNLDGSIAWQKAYGGIGPDRAFAVQQTFDEQGITDGYIVAGTTSSYGVGYSDIWVLKLNIDGSLAWQKTYGSEISYYHRAFDIKQTANGGYVVAGWAGTDEYYNGYSAYAWMLKLDRNGGILGCGFEGDSNAVVTDTSAVIPYSSFMLQEPATGSTDTSVIPQNALAQSQLVCTTVLPTIGNSPASFSFFATQGGSNPSTESLIIWNAGDGTLSWSVSGNATWLSLNPASGTNSGTVAVSVNIAGLTAETYNATITITATGAANSPVTIPVTLTVNPPLTLLSPNGGEVIASGATYTIRWSAPPEAVRFDIGYSLDDGSAGTWKLIASNVIDYSYNWTVPSPDGNKNTCRVGVRGYNASGGVVGTDTSDNPFAIEVVKLTDPNGGETLTSGTSYQITWQTNGTIRPVQSVQIYGSPNEGQLGTWKLLTTVSGNPGFYNWTVPQVGTAKDRCRLGLRLLDSTSIPIGQDAGDGNFTVQPAP
jgi:uncharacterized delta-60 repeat protein